MDKVLTNELKKGDWVLLNTGWVAQLADNLKGNTRMCKVYGIETEYGSVYAHEMRRKLADVNPATQTYTIVADIEYTDSQRKLARNLEDGGW